MVLCNFLVSDLRESSGKQASSTPWLHYTQRSIWTTDHTPNQQQYLTVPCASWMHSLSLQRQRRVKERKSFCGWGWPRPYAGEPFCRLTWALFASPCDSICLDTGQSKGGPQSDIQRKSHKRQITNTLCIALPTAKYSSYQVSVLVLTHNLHGARH